MIKKYRFKISTNSEYQEIDNVEIVVERIEQLQEDDVIYIYDLDTQQRFVIEIYDGDYFLSIINYYKSFTKDVLIKYIRQGFEIFKKIYRNPEAEGFVWEDDGGM